MKNIAISNPRRAGISPLWIVIPLSAILFAMGWSNLGGLTGAILGGAGGVVWILVLAGIVRLVQRSEKWTGRLATVVLIAAGVNLFAQMGGGLYETMLMLKALETTPEWIVTITSGPLGEQVILFFILFNTLMEAVLVPLAILLNWNYPRRRALVLAAAGLFYAIRIWTYLYFAPQYFDFGTTAFTQEFIDALRLRISREPLRAALMITEAALFFRAAFIPTAELTSQSGPNEIGQQALVTQPEE